MLRVIDTIDTWALSSLPEPPLDLLARLGAFDAGDVALGRAPAGVKAPHAQTVAMSDDKEGPLALQLGHHTAGLLVQPVGRP